MNLDFHEICRLCLRICDTYIDLHQNNGFKNLSSEISEAVEFCYCIQIDMTDGLPTKICHQCVQVLTFFYVTKKNAMVSEQLLKNILSVKNKYESSEIQSYLESNSTTSELDEGKNKENNNSDEMQLPCTIRDQNNINLNVVNNFHTPNSSSLWYDDKFSIYNTNKPIKQHINDLVINNEWEKRSKNKEKVKESHFMEDDKEVCSNEIDLDRLIMENKNLEFMATSEDEKHVTCNAEKMEGGRSSNKGSKNKGRRKAEHEKITSNPKKIKLVIDENNILSSEVKRCRRTIS